jgi:membrane-associated protease RseP (regulator of RpoE activity)
MGITALMVFLVRWAQWNSAGDPLRDAALFTVVLGAILGAHEAGHILAARWYGFRLGLPLFLPLPVWVGTLGAVIQVQELPPSRSALLAMGAGGPLAGFAVIVLAALCNDPSSGGEALPAPGVFQVCGWLSGADAIVVTSDPVGFAAWVGCLVTALNLFPLGQLDGGHIFAALWPGREGRATVGTLGLLCVLGVWWWPWLAWAAVLGLLLREPLGVRQRSEVPRGFERFLAAACVLVWVLCFTPVPFPL